jgi:hypothetical protein
MVARNGRRKWKFRFRCPLSIGKAAVLFAVLLAGAGTMRAQTIDFQPLCGGVQASGHAPGVSLRLEMPQG